MTVPNWNRCAQTMFDIMVSNRLCLFRICLSRPLAGLRARFGCVQAMLDENRHVSLTDTPPEEERSAEPEPGTSTQARMC